MLIPDRIVTTTCPYCGVGCKLQLHVKDVSIFKVTSPFDAVVTRAVAEDVVAWDQLGCLSPQVIYIADEAGLTAEQFAERLACTPDSIKPNAVILSYPVIVLPNPAGAL